MANPILGFAAFLLAINTALAITCYKCDSSNGITCPVGGLLSFTYATEDCNAAASGDFLGQIGAVFPKKCVKLVAEDNEGKEYTYRGCIPSLGPIDGCNAIAKTVQFMNSKETRKLECFTCDTDKCNSAPKITSITIVAVLLACFVFLF